MTLKAALVAMETGNYGAARDALVTAWQQTRSPAIAELVDVLDRQAPDALSAQLAAIITPRVVTSLANLERLKRVDDPRLAGWAIDALVNLPFTAVTARDFLVAVAHTAVRHDDPRLAARQPQIDDAVSTRIGRLAIRQELLAIVAQGVAKLPEPPAVDVSKLAALVEPLQRGTRSADALLAEIYANPTDDAPRLVYADALSEQGDPRGEFIVMQIERGDSEPSAREQELLKKHGKVWLGALAPVLSWGKGYARTTFRRGFVSTADIILSVGKKLRPLLTHPAWATVESIQGLYMDDSGLLAHAPLRALSSLVVNLNHVPWLAARTDKLATVKHITVTHFHEEFDGPLLRAAFPSVQTLFVPVGQITTADVEKFTTLGIEHVKLRDSSETPIDHFVEQLLGTPARISHLTLLRLRGDETYELHRDAKGKYARSQKP